MQETKKATFQNLIAYPWNLLFRTSENLTGIVLAVIVGIGAGFGAVVFWKMVEFSSWFFFNRGATWLSLLGESYVVVLPAIGGLIAGPIVYLFAREAKGDGIPEVMKSYSVGGGRMRSRVSAIKVLVSSICVGSGGSAGREGPIVQIGGSIGSTVGQWLKIPEDWRKELVLCGVAGGVAATFNVPIAGAFFALEIIQRRIVEHNVGYVLISSVMASIIARIFLFTEKNPASFIVPEYSLFSYWEYLLYVLLGLICAVVAVVFIRFFYKIEDIFGNLPIHDYLKPMVGGVIVGSIGLFYPEIFGVGYGPSYGVGGVFQEKGTVDDILIGQLGVGLILSILLLKMFATSVTLGSGGSGGAFAPSLFIGAAIGGTFGIVSGSFYPDIVAPSGAYALVGMASFFAVMVRGPVTAIIILFEMTGNYKIILPVMTAVVIGTVVFRTFMRESIYSLGLKRKGIDLRQMEERDIMRTVTVSEAMTLDFPAVSPKTKVISLLRTMETMGHHGFPVKEKGNFIGIVTLTDVHAATEKEDIDMDQLTVNDIVTKSPIVAYPDQTLHQALFQLGAMDFGRIPVVDRKDPKKLLGLLRRHDIVRAYINGVSNVPSPK